MSCMISVSVDPTAVLMRDRLRKKRHQVESECSVAADCATGRYLAAAEKEIFSAALAAVAS